MLNQILFILSILALLMHPLSLLAQNSFSLSLDVNSAAGDQAVTSATVSADEVIAIQVFGKDIQNATGVSVRFEYDTAQVSYERFDAGTVLPNANALTEQGTNPIFVKIGIVSFGGQASVKNGLLGTIRFRTLAAFSGSAIRLVRAELVRGGQTQSVTLNLQVALQLPVQEEVLTPDFDGDGQVGFSDFVLFGGQYGSRQGDGEYEAKYDLDSNGVIGFSDFVIFGGSYGKEVSTPNTGDNSGGSETNQVTIPDAHLRAVIEDRLGKASGAPITRNDLATLTDLKASHENIRDLTGLEFATNLTSLTLGDRIYSVYRNSISDLTPLSGLTSLTYLNLSSNKISDISALSNLTSLTELYLGFGDGVGRLGKSNTVSDLSPLSGLTSLTKLHLDNNSISDVSALSNLTSLAELYLSGNSISDISALSNLTSLTELYLSDNSISDVSVLTLAPHVTTPDSDGSTAPAPNATLTEVRYLYLSGNSISDVSALSSLTSLQVLNLGDNAISDVSGLSSLTNLQVLNLFSNSISDVSGLSSLTNLQVLSLFSNSISDVSDLSGLTNLTRLYLNNNNISDVSGLSSLTNLQVLNLGFASVNGGVVNNNTISDLSPLSNLTSLTELHLDNNSIEDVSGLSSLTNLRDLYLSDNSISDVSGLSGLTNLEVLLIFNNSISDVSGLSGLTNLEKLWLFSNSISDVSALSGLTHLTHLYISSNSISDLAPLIANTGLSSGDVVDVSGNPLSATSISTHIPALQSRGVDVRFSASKSAVEEQDIRREMMESLRGEAGEAGAYISRR